MAYGTPTDPVAGTVITVAYAVANLLDPIRALRQFTGNADAPGSNYVVTSDSTSATSWKTMAAAVLAALGYTPVNKAGDTMTGNLTFSDPLEGPILAGGSHIRDDTAGNQMQILVHDNRLIIYRLNASAVMADFNDGALTISGLLSAGSAAITGAITAASLTTSGNISGGIIDGTAMRQGGTSVLSRAIHTGTQAPSTISPQGSGSALDADTVDAKHAADFLNLAGGGSNQTVSFTGGSVVVGATGYIPASGPGMTINGSLSVTGSKARAAMGADGVRRAFHALESPEPYFEDFGHAEGRDYVQIVVPEDFARHVLDGDYFIFLTPYGDVPVRVFAKSPQAFVVAGPGRIAFDWRVTARQGDLPATRLAEVVEAAPLGAER